jgi:tRNA(Ile)-lysidine synthase
VLVTAPSLQDRFAGHIGQLLGPDFPADIALAVSGGGDSMAMLYLAHNWAHVFGVRLWVVTIDHGLRSESAAEAAMVATECAAMGHPHATLRWHWDGTGNLQDAARTARLELIDRWRQGIGHVLFAHTRDDVAETFLMRLARGSGVEGLSAMASTRKVTPHFGARPGIAPADITAADLPPASGAGARGDGFGFRLVRPLLQETRADLRHYLTTLGGKWVDDPSNDDPRFDRVQARHAMAALTPLGLTADRLADTASRLARSRDALAARARDVAARVVQEGTAHGIATGQLLFARDGFAGVERDTQLRLLAAALQWVANAPYRPRATALEALLDRLLSGGGGTLHGCEVRAERDQLRVFREFGALAGVISVVGQDAAWDMAWSVSGPDIAGLAIRALGTDGWAQIPEKPADAPPFHAARSLPAVFDGDRLIACRALGFGPAHVVSFCPRGGRFAASGFSH